MRAVTILPPAPEIEPAWHVPDTMPPTDDETTDPEIVSLERFMCGPTQRSPER